MYSTVPSKLCSGLRAKGLQIGPLDFTVIIGRDNDSCDAFGKNVRLIFGSVCSQKMDDKSVSGRWNISIDPVGNVTMSICDLNFSLTRKDKFEQGFAIIVLITNS